MNTQQKGLKLELRGETEIVFTRHFAAPRELVYDCHTKPELMRRWLTGPDGWEFDRCEVDLIVGGKYLYSWKHPQRATFGMHGSFREIVQPERVVNTESYIPDMTAFNPNTPEDVNAAALNTLVLTSEGDQTLMTLTCKYPSAEIRKMVMQTGMETGMEASYKRLDALLQADA